MIDRKAVYLKCDGHCAYCGKKITLRTMQVDHIQPKSRGGTDDFKNLMPSCRSCNHYKRADTLEEFREKIATIAERCHKIYINRVAEDFGILHYHLWYGADAHKLFYFERSKK